jgi:hypothetical protein
MLGMLGILGRLVLVLVLVLMEEILKATRGGTDAAGRNASWYSFYSGNARPSGEGARGYCITSQAAQQASLSTEEAAVHRFGQKVAFAYERERKSVSVL